MTTIVQTRKRSADFSWEILMKNLQLLLFPILQTIFSLIFIAYMWTSIFDIPVSTLMQQLADETAVVVQNAQEQTKESEKAVEQASTVLFQHINMGYMLLFLLCNYLLGLYFNSAMTIKALAIVREENTSLITCFCVALIRYPLIVIWSIINSLVGFFFILIEDNFIGDMIGVLLDAAWSVLTFFTVVAILDKGCGPFKAIALSKDTLKSSCKKIFKQDTIDIRSLRRGFYIGGPIFVLNLILSLLISAIIFFDFSNVTGSGHHASAGTFVALLIILLINTSWRSSMWAVVKSVLYVWANEGKISDSIDSSQLSNAFIEKISTSR